MKKNLQLINFAKNSHPQKSNCIRFANISAPRYLVIIFEINLMRRNPFTDAAPITLKFTNEVGPLESLKENKSRYQLLWRSCWRTVDTI